MPAAVAGSGTGTGFLTAEGLLNGRESAAFLLEYDAVTGELSITAQADLEDTSAASIAALYLSVCDSKDVSPYLSKNAKTNKNISSQASSLQVPTLAPVPISQPRTRSEETREARFRPIEASRPIPASAAKAARSNPKPPVDTMVFAKPPKPKQVKKYKPVAKKVRPLLADLPDKFRIRRHIIGDPLATMPELDPNPPPFKPTGRYTQERRDALRGAHAPILWPAELDMMDDFMCKHEKAFAWDDSERGRFKPEYFPPIDIPVVPHTPWVLKNIPIPPGLYKEICAQVKAKIDAGVYEPSNSSYRSRWFWVLKKDGKSLRLVHSLEPLNAVTIQHSGVPPVPDHLAEQFAGRACGATLDLYVGYDERLIAESSRDLTTFQTPYGAHRLVTLPMGWSNSVPIFHDDVTFILQEEIPHLTLPYVDDVTVKGPKSDYRLDDGSYEVIPQNPGIRRFVWEHFGGVNRVVTRMEYAGGTFSGKAGKIWLLAIEYAVIGHWCTPRGRVPDKERIEAIQNWVTCADLSEVRAFLGTVGVARIFIKSYAARAHHLQKLTRKDVPFEWGPEQEAAMTDLKEALLTSPALRPLDYDSEAPVILAVDTSIIAVGFHLCQEEQGPPVRRYYNRFGSITLNARESRFSQPKLELYGLYRAFRALRLYIVGVRNLKVETDASYIRGMLANPDMAPSASINRWIMAILLFHFELVHVPGTSHAPDGLSRRRLQPGESLPPDDESDNEFDDWVDKLHGLLHLINSPPPLSDAPGPEHAPVYAPHRKPDGTAESVAVFFQQTASSRTGKRPRVTPPPYENCPRSSAALAYDAKLEDIRTWLSSPLELPEGVPEKQIAGFLQCAQQFFIGPDGALFRRSKDGMHKHVLPAGTRMKALAEFHDYLGHRGLFATRAFVCDRYWWPGIKTDIAWYVKTCHECQIRQTTKILIPPTVPLPATPMARVHVDTMMMPNQWRILHARCGTTSWSEARAVQSETAKVIGDWLFQELICRWGSLCELVTDNGTPWVAAARHIEEAYRIRNIRISGYNSRANGIVEGPHYHLREALAKDAARRTAALDEAAEREPDAEKRKKKKQKAQDTWLTSLYAILWADRVTVRKRLGCSPFFAITGSHPILPFDLMEATWISPVPDSLISTDELLLRRADALRARRTFIPSMRLKVLRFREGLATTFDEAHPDRIRDYDFKRGQLVLLRNTAIEKSLDRKMKQRYLGPLVVVSRNKGGAYVLAELNGAVLDRPIAAFRVAPYFARTEPIEYTDEELDVSVEELVRLVRRDDAGDEGLEEEEEGTSGEEEDLEGGPDEGPARGHHGGDSATTGAHQEEHIRDRLRPRAPNGRRT